VSASDEFTPLPSPPRMYPTEGVVFVACPCGALFAALSASPLSECRECTRLRRIVSEVINSHPAITFIAGKP
jgi:hypothetical protein